MRRSREKVEEQKSPKASELFANIEFKRNRNGRFSPSKDGSVPRIATIAVFPGRAEVRAYTVEPEVRAIVMTASSDE